MARRPTPLVQDPAEVCRACPITYDSLTWCAELSRQPPSAKKNDRLQERLAKAVGNRAAVGSSDSSNLALQADIPAATLSSARTSVDSRQEEGTSLNGQAPESVAEPRVSITIPSPEGVATELEVDPVSQPRASFEAADQVGNAPSTNPPSPVRSSSISNLDVQEQEGRPSEELVRQLRSDYESAELRRQEEVHEYLERIDALQAKLKILAKEAAETARTSAGGAGAGSLEEKLAKKDEQIALLMEEGQQLSQNELRLMTTIKKIRAKSLEDEKKMIASKAAAEKAERANAAAIEKAKAAEAAHDEEIQRVKRLERDLDRARAELSTRSTRVGELQSQLNQAKAAASTEELTKTKKLLDEERSAAIQLQEDLATLKIEKKLGDDRHRTQIKELEENTKREKERARVADLELKGEIGILESRLETYRAQAEEISSGSTGDTQVKLFRQIETLQTQYSAASENWRGIESSLLARITGLEKDRDELVAKETELRRKNREASSKTRRAEDELEQANAKVYEIDEKFNQQVALTSSLRTTLDHLQVELGNTRTELQASQEQVKALQQEMERKDMQILHVPAAPMEPASPLPAGHRSPIDKSYTWSRRHQGNSSQALKDLIGHTDRPSSRKSSVQVGGSYFSPARQDFIVTGSGRGSTTQTPSIQTEHQDDLFDGMVTPATPERTINEMFSGSTAGAGPSVQLVERMSSAVRRLESEKAASKEEVDRLHTQRDELREQVVSLMREVEEKRKVDTRVTELEAEVASLNKRYQTTLEMLGEKSERVEELQADIADMKEIYKEALEKSMR